MLLGLGIAVAKCSIQNPTGMLCGWQKPADCTQRCAAHSLQQRLLFALFWQPLRSFRTLDVLTLLQSWKPKSLNWGPTRFKICCHAPFASCDTAPDKLLGWYYDTCCSHFQPRSVLQDLPAAYQGKSPALWRTEWNKLDHIYRQSQVNNLLKLGYPIRARHSGWKLCRSNCTWEGKPTQMHTCMTDIQL